MSHFSVAVFTNDEEQAIDDLLAPYDENIRVAPYVKSSKAQIIQVEKDTLQRIFDGEYSEWKKNCAAYEAKCENLKHIEYLKTIPERMKWTDEQLYQEAIKHFEQDELTPEGDLLSTYNPNSKWDWYKVGGRWEGLLIPKTRNKGAENFKKCDSAYVSDIDFEAMKRHKMAELSPYEEAMKEGFFKEKYMREMFPSEEEYIKRSTNFGTYAVITPDGIWHSPGTMGWWGISSETSGEEREWDFKYYERFIKPAIENNWYMTIVDCHI